jgi:hypothetical protein
MSFTTLSGVPRKFVLDPCWSMNTILMIIIFWEMIIIIVTAVETSNLTEYNLDSCSKVICFSFLLFCWQNCFCHTGSCDDCFLLYSDINSVHNLCSPNYMKLNTAETKFLPPGKLICWLLTMYTLTLVFCVEIKLKTWVFSWLEAYFHQHVD